MEFHIDGITDSAPAGGISPASRDLRLVLLLLAAVNAAGAAFLYYEYLPARRDEALARVPAQLSLLARDRQNAMSGWVSERFSDAGLAASLLAAGDDDSAPATLDHFIRAYRYETATIVDGGGTLLVHRGGDDTDAATIIDFVRNPVGRSNAWIDFRRTAGREPKILTASRFVAGGDSAQQRTVVLVSDPYAYVYPLFRTVSVGSKTGETNLIGLDGVWATALNPYRFGTDPPMTSRTRLSWKEAAQALARDERSIRMRDRRGEPVIGVVKAIPRTPWVVFTKMDIAEVTEGAAEETVRLSQLFAFVTVLLATTAFAILRSRRVHQMRAAEVELARLYENTPTGVLVLRVLLDDDGAPVDHQVVAMNPAAEAFFGVDAGEEIGKRSADAPYLQWPLEIRERNYAVVTERTTTQYERYDPDSGRWYDVRAFWLMPGQVAQLVTDVTERKESEEAFRKLSARVLRVQDETQRRIARDLHDSVAQSLGGLRMNLAVIQRHVDGDGASEIVADSIGIVDDAVAEVRTMSYLLHPPMIEQAGLPTALRWYVDGFQQRSGIATTLEVPADLERLPRDVETAVFRIVQEGLTNVQRHSGSSTARITVRRDAERLVVTIGDEGCGLTPAFRENHSALLAAGVGVAGINERVHELGGELTIASSEHGTSLNVALPVAATESAQ